MTALSLAISTIVLAFTDVFRGSEGDGGGSPAKNERVPKKWLDRLADALKRLARKAAEALRVAVGSVVVIILSFLDKAVRFVAEHTWDIIAFVAGPIGVWLMQRLMRKQAGKK